MSEQQASDLNFREIRVTETGIHLDDQRIPIYALSPNVTIGAGTSGSQTITLTIHADRVVFEGKAEARVDLPASDGSDPNAYPQCRDEHSLADKAIRFTDTYSHIERDHEYVGVEDRTPTSRPAGFGPVDARPHIASLDNMVKDMTARVTDAQERYYIPTRYVAGTSPLTEQAIRPPRRLTTEELNSEAVRNLNINRPM